MKVQLFYNRVVIVTAGIKKNFIISFKCVDVVEHEEWFGCEDTDTVAIFPVDNVKSDQLVCILIKPLFKTRSRKSMPENFPYVDHKGLFGENNIIICEAEAMKVP